jgi:hypothetical protein
MFHPRDHQVLVDPAGFQVAPRPVLLLLDLHLRLHRHLCPRKTLIRRLRQDHLVQRLDTLLQLRPVRDQVRHMDAGQPALHQVCSAIELTLPVRF